MTNSTTPNTKQELDLNHLKDARSVLKWCYDHGLLKGEFPDSDSSSKSYVLDEAEKRLSELLKPLLTDSVKAEVKKVLDELRGETQDMATLGGLVKELIDREEVLSAIEQVRKEWS